MLEPDPHDHVRTMPALDPAALAARARVASRLARWALALALIGAGLVALGAWLTCRGASPTEHELRATGAPIDDPPLDE